MDKSMKYVCMYMYTYAVAQENKCYTCKYICTCTSSNSSYTTLYVHTCTLLLIFVRDEQFVQRVFHRLATPRDWTMATAWYEFQHLLITSEGIRGLGTTQHELGVEETLNETDVPFLLQVNGHLLAPDNVTEKRRRDLHVAVTGRK